MKSAAKTPRAYLDSLPADRREAIAKVRDVILENLPKGYEEVLDFGMLAYVVPLELCSDTYNGRPLAYVALASQKQYMAVYLTCVYGHPKARKWFQDEYRRSGKRLDMGKSCVRFKSLDDLPLELIGRAVARVPVDELVRIYEKSRAKAKAAKNPRRR